MVIPPLEVGLLAPMSLSLCPQSLSLCPQPLSLSPRSSRSLSSASALCLRSAPSARTESQDGELGCSSPSPRQAAVVSSSEAPLLRAAFAVVQPAAQAEQLPVQGEVCWMVSHWFALHCHAFAVGMPVVLHMVPGGSTKCSRARWSESFPIPLPNSLLSF